MSEPSAGPVQVMVYVAPPPDEPDAVADAYRRISRALAGTPGLRGNRLLRSVHDARDCVVVSEWESLAAFRAWEAGESHRDTTAPLRPYQHDRKGSRFALYQVAAEY